MFLLLWSRIHAQDNDSIRLKKYQKVIYPDTSIIVKSDITIPYDADIVKVKQRRLARFYHHYMFSDPQDSDVLKRPGTPNHWSGKVVGEIRIKKLEPFGTTIADSSQSLVDWFINAGNTIHITTRDKIIFNNLLFNHGDRLTRNTLEESERILRRLPFILDAHVYGVSRPSAPDTVDIYVITKDVFSYSVNLNITNYDAVHFAMENTNMFGLGQRFYNNFIFDANRRIGYEGKYTVYNLYGTYLEGALSMAFTEDSLLAGISNEREFISPEIRNAGGLSYHYRIRRYYSRFDENRSRTEVADNHLDGWYGRNFPLSTRDTVLLGRLNYVASGRISSTWFTQRPFASADTNLAFQNNTLFLVNTGISRSAFAKDILVTNFGVVEDIPIGLLTDVTLGYAIGEFVSRFYSGMRLSFGTFTAQGYFFNTLEIGSFFRNKKAEDGALRISSTYISKIFARKKLFKGRILLRTLYVRGINRTNADDRIDLFDVEALRGLESELLFGNTALAGGATLSMFTPWYLLGFRVGLFALADLTYFSKQGNFIFSGRPHWGLSSGIRLNNQSFIFGNIDFSVSVYPAPPAGANLFKINFALNPIFPFLDFNGKKPSTIQYGQTNKLYY